MSSGYRRPSYKEKNERSKHVTLNLARMENDIRKNPRKEPKILLPPYAYTSLCPDPEYRRPSNVHKLEES